MADEKQPHDRTMLDNSILYVLGGTSNNMLEECKLLCKNFNSIDEYDSDDENIILIDMEDLARQISRDANIIIHAVQVALNI